MDSRDPITSVTSHCCVCLQILRSHSRHSTHGQVLFFCSLTLGGPPGALPIHSESRTDHGSWYVSLKKDCVDLWCREIRCLHQCIVLRAVLPF